MHFELTHHGALVRIVWQVAVLALGCHGIQSLVEGSVMLTGVHVDRTFNFPLAARSLREFWGRRWNLAFSAIAKQHLVRPLLARGMGKVWVFALVFVFSAVCHEYLVLVTRQQTTGAMGLFFLLQGAAFFVERSWVEHGWPKLPPALGRLAFWGWMLVTVPLFFAELGAVITVFS